MFTQAIYDYLRADSTLTEKLSTWNGAPAIFTSTVPNSADKPYIEIGRPLRNDSDNTKNDKGREYACRVHVYTNEQGTVRQVEDICERVRNLFDRPANITISGFYFLDCNVSGAVEVPEEQFTHWVLTPVIRSRETN